MKPLRPSSPWITCVAALGLLSSGAPVFGDIIPPERRTDWSSAGIPGGIPERTIIFCDVTQSIPGTSRKAIGDGIADDTDAIETAIKLCPKDQVVFLPAGVYRITRQIVLGQKSHVTLRGAGMGKTVIRADFDSPTIMFKWGSGVWNAATSDIKSVTSGHNKGSSEITLSDLKNVSVGTLLHIDQLNDPALVNPEGSSGWSGDRSHKGLRCVSQMVKVTRIEGNKVSIWPALHWTYKAELKPEAVVQRGSAYTSEVVRRSGIEDLTLTTANSNLTDYIHFYTVNEVWLKGVEFRKIVAKAVFLHYYLNAEIRGCYFNDAFYRTVGQGYGMIIRLGTGVLVADNIFDKIRVPFWIHAGSSGGVAAYNYTHSVWSDDSALQNSHYNGGHGPHGMMNLFEGNVGHSYQMDCYFGSASHNTVFRNHLHGSDPNDGGLKRVISLDRWMLTNNIVGNVLGSANKVWEYEIDEKSYDQRRNTIYRLGFPNMGNNGYSLIGDPNVQSNLDPRVKQTLLRHGNYDYATRSVRWSPEISERSIPPSLFLTSRPEWWPATVPWPPIGPDLSPMASKIPAQLRYEAYLTPPPQPPNNLRIISAASR
jgi:hypothetical protein